MSQQLDNVDFIRRYLLGELSEQEQEQVEQRLLSDDDFYEQVRIAEEELIFDFVYDEMPTRDRARFTEHALPVPERRQDMRFARALRRYVAEHAQSKDEATFPGKERAPWLTPFAAFFRRPIIGFALATAFLLTLSLSIWMAIQNQRLRNQVVELQMRQLPTPTPQDTQEQLASERRRNAELSAELQREQERRSSVERDLEAMKEQEQRRSPSVPPTRTAFASYLLTSGVTRDSGELKKIALPDAKRGIYLQLDLAANDYPSYRAVLKTVGGQKELLTKNMLRARTGGGRITVTLSLPANLLSRGDYQIQLSGVTAAGQSEAVDTYYFRVAE